MQQIDQIAQQYGFNAIDEGHHLTFLMLITGEMPHILYRHPPSMLKLDVALRPDEDLLDAITQVDVDLQSIFNAWRDSLDPLEAWLLQSPPELNDQVDWFYRVKVKGERILDVALSEAASESTISVGIRRVQQFLALRVRRGRPKKKRELTAQKFDDLFGPLGS